MTKWSLLLFALALAVSTASTAPASATRFQTPDQEDSEIDPGSFQCAEYLELVGAADGRADVRTVWAHGYYSALRGFDESSAPVTVQLLMDFVGQLTSRCEAEPEKLWIQAVKELAEN